ncbi:hypothetical protein D3C78_1684300 [compost metagenome]
MQPIAVFQIPAKGAVKGRLLLTGCHLFTARCGRRYQDGQQIDAGGKAGRSHQQMGGQQQSQSLALHKASVVD